jgi:ABC-type transporter Mla subunit MlaD
MGKQGERGVDSVEGRLAGIEARMNQVEEGVANFRDFQNEARSFFQETRLFQQSATLRDAEKVRYQKELAEALSDKEKHQAEAELARKAASGAIWKKIGVIIAAAVGLISINQYFAPLVREFLAHWLKGQ